MSVLTSSCTSDVQEDDTDEVPLPGPVLGTGTDDFTLVMALSSVNITEGQDPIDVAIRIDRNDGHEGKITLSFGDMEIEENRYLNRQFSDNELSTDERESSVQFNLAIGPKPIEQQSRNLLVIATDDEGQSSSATLNLQILPTNAPDVYLLIGQSNMIGISQFNAKQSAAGQIDEPLEQVRQLNVTFNDDDNFSTPAHFTDPVRLYNTGQPLTIALDPLHSGMEGNGEKSGTQIGLGLSFAKAAMRETSSTIYLVPAAWSDSGFCKRSTNTLPGIGWNATVKSNPALSGTLLHDRAIARTNEALRLTGGILRGILWHQGEADSDDGACAQSYAGNLSEMIQSLRSNIAVDARGQSARGPNADIPFIVGTMSKGGDQAPFSETKALVDSAHRNVSNTVSFADYVNNDDLLPSAYPCGGGSCIHFGAEALREMGVRYHERLISVLQ